MVEFKDVSVTYSSGVDALNKVNLKINDGDFAFVVGPSGAGKSTLIKLVLKEIDATSGTVMVNGFNLKKLRRRKIPALRRTIGVVFQDFRLIPTMTVYENVAFVLRVIDAPAKYIRSRVPYVISLVGLSDKAKSYPTELSGGEQQRVALARALVNDPQLIIADEPTGNIDPALSYEIVELLKGINECGTTILMVTHDMGSIIKYCDKVVLLNKGEFIAEGEPGHMVDLYKKILANQLDSLNEELESDYSGGMLGDEKKAKAEESHSDGSLMKDKITINTDRTEYGDGRAEIFDLGLFDAKGNLTNLLLKGEMFTIKERIRFHAPIKSPIFTYTIRDKKGTDLTGTNTMYEGCDIKPVGDGDVYDVSFTQKMTLQGGEYLLSMSCTGFEGEEHVVYHRLYNIANITVISNKNTVGVYDMESEVETSLTRA